MVNVALEILFLVAIGLSFIAAMAVVFFMQIFDRMVDDKSYRQNFLAFKVFLAAIIFHLFYHIARDFLMSPLLEDLFEILSLVAFFYGIVIITQSVMRTHISYEAHKSLKEEVDKKTEAVKLYALDLKHSNDFKDLFTDIMTHDLLNPIGIIMNYAELMLDDEREFRKENIEAVKRTAKKSAEMIEAAAAFSKVQKIGKEDFVPMDLGEILKEEIMYIEPSAASKKIKVSHNIDGEHPIIAAPFIKEVLSNLLSNAIKYSPEGNNVFVAIEDLGNSWKVEVKDEGEGVDDQYKESIFERFERLQKKGVKGTGLGLAIVKKVVEMHGGGAWVADNPSGGSIFIVEIPKEP
ncbi:MAG: sensor histidine kinase [Candidatus Hydrothermarchaeales archaeon]